MHLSLTLKKASTFPPPTQRRVVSAVINLAAGRVLLILAGSCELRAVSQIHGAHAPSQKH